MSVRVTFTSHDLQSLETLSDWLRAIAGLIDGTPGAKTLRDAAGKLRAAAAREAKAAGDLFDSAK